MASAIGKLHNVATWRLKSILKLRRFYDKEDLMISFKSKILSYLEYRTPAIYHAAGTLLELINGIQSKFLREIGISNEEAFTDYHLAPLTSRRDMAMLGLIHRSVLG